MVLVASGMPREGKLDVTKDKQSGRWFVNVSAKISKTGKRSRRKFTTKKEAETFRETLEKSLQSSRIKHFDQKRMETANYYHEAFQLFGFKGLDDACATWLSVLEKKSPSFTLRELIERYQAARGADWTEGYLITFNWAKKQLVEHHQMSLSQLDTQHWQAWLPKWRKKGGYAPKSFNHLRTFLISIFSMPEAVAVFPANPVKPIPPAKTKRKEVAIASPEEVSKLLNHALAEDPEMLPWFAIAFFAGLRPSSELHRLDWSDINFEEKWIRVNFGNKTDSRRFVDLADNLALWLKPFARPTGKIKRNTNHRKRKDKLVDGILKWARDISRHTYGSHLEAQMRSEGKDSRSKVLENMGHTMLQTFNQHYRNARTAKQAKEYWGIVPPCD
jgi:integrase